MTFLIWKDIKQLITFNIVTVKCKSDANRGNIPNDNFLINTGPSLSKTIPISKEKFKDVLNNISSNMFVFMSVTHDEVQKFISQLQIAFGENFSFFLHSRVKSIDHW